MFKGGIGGYLFIGVRHSVGCFKYLFVQFFNREGLGRPERFHYGLSVSIKLCLHIYAFCINFTCSNPLQSAQSSFTCTQLVAYHNIHNLVNILADVFFSMNIFYRRKDSVVFVFAHVIKQSIVKKDLGKICHAFHRPKVILSLTCHCLTQLVKIATDGSHCILLGLPVVGIGLACLNLHLSDGFFKSHITVAEHNVAIGVCFWTMIVLCSVFNINRL